MARKETSNPRSSQFRRRMQARYAAMNAPCGICHGALGPIRYDEPRDANHPLSLCIDEIIPICMWERYGYPNKEAVALDINNIQPTHRCCNAAKGAKVGEKKIVSKISVVSADW